MPKNSKSSSKKKKLLKLSNNIQVRMYDVGFGDSFLLFIPTSEGTKKILFDCGSIKEGVQPLGKVVDQIVTDVTEADGTPRISVVVCTHRHADHVKGFANARWKTVEVEEVWMPWTEDPTDAEARRILEKQASLASHLSDRLTKLRGLASGKALKQIADYQQIALNALSNESAMSMLHSGFKGNPKRRYLPRKNIATSMVRTNILPGVLVHVLGPSRDEEVIRDMDPPVGQSFLQMVEAEAQDLSRIPNPFSVELCLKPEEYNFPELILSDRFCKSLDDLGEGMEDVVAVALEKAVNGTSLMLLLQIGKSFLLFPGDAQWGTWNRVLKDRDLKELLKKTNFYKVGHHGSHNATPVDFVKNILEKDVWAMVSTHHVDQWPRIPKKELMEALSQLTDKIARSDKPDKNPKMFDSASGIYTDAYIPI